MARYDEIRIGDVAEVVHTITAQDLERFVSLTGDDNRLHVDPAYARTTAFRLPVVHGMLGASFISTVIGTKLPGDGALWFSQTLDFIAPVRVGDQIRVVAEVKAKLDRDRVIELTTQIFNQHRQIVTTGTARVKVVEPLKEQVEPQPDSTRARTALLIGASGGIGAATARQLAKCGYSLLLHCHTSREAAELLRREITESGGQVAVVQADIATKQGVDEVAEHVRRYFTQLDVVVNLATAKIPPLKFEQLEWDDFQRHLDTNLRSSFMLVKALLPWLERGRSPSIVLTTSLYTDAPVTGLLPYITSKAALEGFARALAVDLAPKRIRVNLVSPGMTQTDLIADVPQKSRLLVEAKSPRGRLARSEDVAHSISFLASEAADYITGETLRVNGGQAML